MCLIKVFINGYNLIKYNIFSFSFILKLKKYYTYETAYIRPCKY